MKFTALVAATALLIVAGTAVAAPPATYHLELEANAAAPFPFLSKFGTIALHIYPEGLRAETLWLNGFSKNGSGSVTVENPLGRMYTEIPVTDITSLLMKLAGTSKDHGTPGHPVQRLAPPPLSPPLPGKVRGIDAMRYRIVYGPAAWIDVWTTSAIPENPQLRLMVNQFVDAVSPATGEVSRRIPGMPLYVELNFSHYRKVTILRMKSLSHDDADAAGALSTGALYFKAPFIDALWK